MKSPYQSLGIPESSDPDVVKKAYRDLVKLHHPDRGGDPAKFKEIQQAYEQITSPHKNQPHNPFADFNPDGFDPFDAFSSLFGGDLFGFNQRSQREPRGRDIMGETII